MRVLEVLAWQDLRLSENQANILHFNSLPLIKHPCFRDEVAKNLFNGSRDRTEIVQHH